MKGHMSSLGTLLPRPVANRPHEFLKRFFIPP
jgi:hypothetical protein